MGLDLKRVAQLFAARARLRSRSSIGVLFKLCAGFGKSLAIAILLLLPVTNVLASHATCATDPTSLNVISHNLASSYCELCGDGEIRILVSNSSDQPLTNIIVTENLGTSGLEYITGTTTIDGAATGDPVISGASNQMLTWTQVPAEIPELASLAAAQNHNSGPRTYEIVFRVRRTVGTEEGLVTANRQIEATATFDYQECPPNPLPNPAWPPTTDSTGQELLPLREPTPSVVKTGRNVDAAQTGYTGTVYGNTDDDVIWQVTVTNAGAANLQDLIFSDFMSQNGGEDHLTFVCPTEAEAEEIAITNNGSGPGSTNCIAVINNQIAPLDENNFFFGNPAAVDVTAGGTASIWLVGKVLSSCNNQDNTANNLQWGCQVGATPDGGITQTSAGVTPAPSNASLSTVVDSSGLQIQRQFRGSDLGPNVGTKGTITVTITNNTGGTVKNIVLDDILPAGYYVADPTFTPTITTTSAYGNYPGMTDEVRWDNRDAGTLTNNVAPRLILESSSTHPDAGDNLLRHGDELTVSFRIVMINTNYYDKQADLDVRQELAGVDDPANMPQLDNKLTVSYDEFCGGTATPIVYDDTFTPSPEDLDIDITGTELIFILTNDQNQRLPLTVQLRNRGGHSAADHFTYVSFGETMTVVTAPGSCAVTSNPPPRPVWNLPAAIPATATVYQCTGGDIDRGGATRDYDFEVIKNLASTADDLTFRADVVAEVRLSDDTPLTVPTPSDPIGSTVNNYSLDGIRARVLGFNLQKSQLGACNENNPPPSLPDDNVQIGEQCNFHIDTGGWFGFQTPGFTYIAVQNIQVVDELPNGQGYISSTDPTLTSDPEVTGISLNPAGLAAPDEGWIDWTFNQADRITTKDKWFRVDVNTRILNDPVNIISAPNQHAAISRNELNSYFEAIFRNALGVDEVFNLGPNTVGYPQASVRRVDLTVTEPNITVVKEVCNETQSVKGTACTPFVTLANNGDTNDSYIYRIRLTNQDTSSGVVRAPAYNVTATDVLDASDLMLIVQDNGNAVDPFENDGLDNDGDGLIDGADADEGTISDNIINNATPAQITFSYTHSDALLKIEPGNSVTFYYRVDPDDDIAPLQSLTNTVTMTYDSLEGDFGNQTAPQRGNGNIAGARIYTTSPAQATVQILPVVTQPKQILRVSNTLLGGPPQPVSIGEEIEYQLTTLIPVAKLRSFVIRDELPAGIRCVEAPTINLNAGVYAAAGFVPGGTFIPTCTSTGTNDYVEWNFGDQELTTASGTRFSFPLTFIARVENSVGTNDSNVISNGAPATNVTASYINEVGSTITLSFGNADIVVREPNIALTKAFSAASTDAGDILTVTVTATNNGLVTAYNLRVTDNLVGAKMTFLNSVSGTDPPDNIDTATLGANRPIFSWNTSNPDYALAPGASISFTFTVSVDANVEPAEILSNTLQASWQSLSNQNTALNATGAIGVDGSIMGQRNGAIPNAGDPINDYETTTTTTIPVLATSISKTRISDTYDATSNLRIGDTVTYELRLTLPEGTISDTVLTDVLPQGLRFERVISINGDASAPYSSVVPFTHADLAAPITVGDPVTGPTSVTWNLGQIINAGDNNVGNNDFVIVYEAIVLNGVHPQALNIPLTNTVTLDYTLGGAAAPQQTDTETINIIQPDLTMTKSGPAAVQFGIASTFTLDVQNTGTSRAWDVTLLDQLPNLDPAAGGMCDTPPTTFTARVYLADGITPVSAPLVQGADFIASFAPAPECTLTFTMQTTAAAIDPTQRLIVTYEATPDNDNAGGVSLINIAGATAWFSQDTAGAGATGEIGTYTRTITDGTTTLLDHEDALTVVTEIPVLVFSKEVVNLTTGQDPGDNASPGDVLRYTITVDNTSNFALAAFRLTDEVDRLSGGTALFAPGTLTNVVAPGTADTSNTNATGGSLGSGLLDVRNLTLDADGGANDNFTIVFDVTLASAINNGVSVDNQAEILITNYTPIVSDDPNTGASDDPTSTVISSAPILQIQKVSQDLTGDPAVLDPGDTLRYTITVKNIGNENMVNVSLRDQIPANTSYVANSTRLNGVIVADPSVGVSALQNSFLINAPENTTAGFMRADSSATPNNVATITFDVTISNSAINGTIISNQGFVNGAGAGSGAFPERPSDDPATAIADDPTIDVVGNLPLIDSQKTVQILIDNGTVGVVDPGDTLRYTITVTNSGAQPATGVVITDNLIDPLLGISQVTYVAGSARLEGATTGISFAVPILTADYSGTYGQLVVGATATLTYDVDVIGVAGTVISNQGTISSNEQAPEPTDADGNDSNGDQMTQIAIGNGQQLAISKSVSVVGGGVVVAGGELEYTMVVTNIGSVAATAVQLADAVPANTTYVANSVTLNGFPVGQPDSGVSPLIAGIPVSSSDLTPPLPTAGNGTLSVGGTATIRFRVQVGAVAIGTTITNTAQLTWSAGGNNSASVSVDVGGTPGFANLNGSVWHDADFENDIDGAERRLQNWSVDVYRNSVLVGSVITDANGAYQINGLAPNAGSTQLYELRFRAPGAGATTASMGLAHSAGSLLAAPAPIDGQQRITNIVVGSGSNTQNLNLPIDPNGVVYDSVSRSPVVGAVVSMSLGGTALPTSCFDDSVQQGQVTLADGYYKFDLNFGAGCGTPGSDYVINVAPPASGYSTGESLIIPASSNAASAAYSVPVCSADAIPATADYCEAQSSESVPVGVAATSYYLHQTLNNTTVPGDSQLFNNHIPLDPAIQGTGVTLTKTTPMKNVTRGQLVPYTIVATNNVGGSLPNNDIIDTMPPGFKYVTGSATVGGIKTEPTITGRELRWNNQTLVPNTPLTIKLILIIGAGVGEGEYVNQALVYNTTLGTNVSQPASATVRIIPDPMFDCSDVIGKVFDDRNGNGYQDDGEPGLAGTRVATVNGLLTTTDKHGRFHIACAAVPNRDRGSNFILKLDTRSLPSGYRMTTENPRVQRLTRGKISKFNFGATLQHVVRLDLSDAAFVPVRNKLRPEWQPSIDKLIKQMQKGSQSGKGKTVLRISYLGDAETASMVKARIKRVKLIIADKWKALGKRTALSIETEVFWRRGKPGEGGGSTPSRDSTSFSRLNGLVSYSDVGENTEALLPDAELTVWARDKSFRLEDGDQVYFRSRTIEQIETTDEQQLSLIAVSAGKPMVSEESIVRVRELMNRIGEGKRIRLQFIGHSDQKLLTSSEQKQYGDHITASMQQAKLAAEYFRRELNLGADQIKVEGRGNAEPLQQNILLQQAKSNRRVEVKLFIEQINTLEVEEAIVVPRAGVKELRVCRVEEACIVVRKKKNARKIEIRNLVAAIRFMPEGDRISAETIGNLKKVFTRYRDKPNVQLQFTGHVDNAAINTQAIDRYGNKQGLSRAHARVVANQVRRALGLARHQISYDGKGDSDSIAINSTARGRALNRRVEVSLWYDAPEDIVSISGPQTCNAGGPDMISQRYLPGGQNPIAPIVYEKGKPVINDAILQQAQSLLTQLADKPNLRIVFAGYTDKSLLNRRGAIAYGDNWGLAEVRAKQVKDSMQQSLNLSASMLSYEGKGLSDSSIIDQGRVLQSTDGYVDVEIWFDVLAPTDDDVMAELKRIERTTEPVNPYTLAPLRITADGKRIDGSLPHQADVQRCTDVALDKTRIKLNYDGHKLEPRLNVAASSVAISSVDDAATELVENRVRFKAYSNYPAMISNAEVRLFRLSQSLNDAPLAIVKLNDQWQGEWQASNDTASELKYVLRAIGQNGQFDETKPKRLRVMQASNTLEQMSERELALSAYGENTLRQQMIPLYGGTITVNAISVPEGHQVWVMNQLVPMDNQGRLVSQHIIPKGMHTIEVAVLDSLGNGQVYLRDLNFDKRDWFYTGIADITAGVDATSGQASEVTGDTTHYNNDVFSDGRLAFYVKGSTRNSVEITASMDTQEGSLAEVFTGMTDRNPRNLLRRMDTDYENYVYPSFGDDSTSTEDAPTQGKFYLKLKKDNNFGLWGNFKVAWLDTDLARIDRGLYGAYGHYEDKSSTSFGERRMRLDSFIAEPGTLRAREEFRGTGGSLYFMRQQDITQGSDSVWVEVRDADSGMVLKTNRLVVGQDYTIDPIQGRLQLTVPLPSTADDSQLVQSGSLSGHPVYLLVHYEYVPGVGQLDDSSVAIRGSRWMSDKVKFGFTYSNEQQMGQAQKLGAADITLRKSAGTYIKLEYALSKGQGNNEYQSNDGGYVFSQIPQNANVKTKVSANRIEVGADLHEFMKESRGKFNAYFQQREGGFSAQGQLTASDTTQYGGNLNLPFGESNDFNLKFDATEVEQGLNTEAVSIDYGRRLNKHWKMTTGIRHDSRDDQSLVVPATQTEGERTDAAVRMTYESDDKWKAYGYLQTTLSANGTRNSNNRLGSGGEYQVNKRLKLMGEASGGDLGMGAKFGVDYLLNDDTSLYSTYALDNERDVSGLRTTKGNFVNGFRSKTSDSMSIYGEERYTHGDVPTGLTHAYGVDLTPNKEWRFGANFEMGNLFDPRTSSSIDRTAMGLSAGFTNDTYKYRGAFEYRQDDTSTATRTTYLLKNKLTYQASPNWRVFGKLNLSDSVSSLGAFYDGRFVESVLGYAYRPVDNDRWNTVFKYSYLHNMPAANLVAAPTATTDYLQRSHVLALDSQYDLSKQWTIGTKIAYRFGQLSIDRVNPQFFDSRGQLIALRADWHVVRNWDLMIEGRIRNEIDAQDMYTGVLLGVYHHVGNNLKIGGGYNFSNFSDDLTNMGFNSQGLFINVIGKF